MAAQFVRRFVNARRSSVNEARAEIWMIYRDSTIEGVGYRRFRQIALKQSRNSIFGKGPEELEALDAFFVVNFVGLDDVSGQNVHVRKSYAWRDIRFGEIFADILILGEDGVPRIDYRKLNLAEPQDAAVEV